MRKIVKILVEISLFLAKIIILIKKMVIGIFNKLIKWPAFFILKFIYHSLVLPIYRSYLFIIKKIAFKKSKEQKFFTAILTNKRLIHVLIILLTTVVVYGNLTAARDAIASEEVVGKTILGKLVFDELANADQLIEEYQEEGIMHPTQSSYLDQYAFLEPDQTIATREELDLLEDFDPDMVDVVVPVGETGIATSRTVQDRTDIVEYTVQPGDTISTIAQAFGITVNTILWENNLTSYSYIKPGQELTILPESGVRHRISSGDSLIALAKKYDVSQEDIMVANNIDNANQLRIGQLLMIPGGTQFTTTARSTTTSSTSVASNSSGDSAKPVYGSKMNWPTQGHTITQYYSWRHNGLDIANKIGTPIYAADAGTIEIAGWNSGGYGNQIVIDHGGGKQTRYAHLSSFGVKVGDTVDKGQYIGGMGSTGRSTGSHLHFEVIIDGKRYNPLNYVEY